MAETRLNPKKPIKPQFNAPIITKINETTLKIFIIYLSFILIIKLNLQAFISQSGKVLLIYFTFIAKKIFIIFITKESF